MPPALGMLSVQKDLVTLVATTFEWAERTLTAPEPKLPTSERRRFCTTRMRWPKPGSNGPWSARAWLPGDRTEIHKCRKASNFPHKRLESQALMGEFLWKREKGNWPALHQPGDDRSNIAMNAEGAVCNDMGDRRLLQVDADIAGIWILEGVLPEGILDNGGCVAPTPSSRYKIRFPSYWLRNVS